LRAARFGRRPDFAIGPTVEYLPDEQTYGLSITVALPFWDQKKGEIQTATAEQQRALAETEKAQIEIGSAVTKAAEKLEVAKNGANQLTPGSVIAVRTGAGHYAKVKINPYGYNLDINWVTYAS
jgi:hypothetical protein